MSKTADRLRVLGGSRPASRGPIPFTLFALPGVAAQGVLFYFAFSQVDRADPSAASAQLLALGSLFVGLLGVWLLLRSIGGGRLSAWTVGAAGLGGMGLGAIFGLVPMEVSPVCPPGWYGFYVAVMLGAIVVVAIAVGGALLYWAAGRDTHAWNLAASPLILLLGIHLVLAAALLVQAESLAGEARRIAAGHSGSCYLPI